MVKLEVLPPQYKPITTGIKFSGYDTGFFKKSGIDFNQNNKIEDNEELRPIKLLRNETPTALVVDTTLQVIDALRRNAMNIQTAVVLDKIVTDNIDFETPEGISILVQSGTPDAFSKLTSMVLSDKNYSPGLMRMLLSGIKHMLRLTIPGNVFFPCKENLITDIENIKTNAQKHPNCYNSMKKMLKIELIEFVLADVERNLTNKGIVGLVNAQGRYNGKMKGLLDKAIRKKGTHKIFTETIGD